MRFSSPLIRGTLIQRYKRFLADVQLPTGEIVTAHCTNTGSMLGCKAPGSAVYLSRSPNPNRKLAYTWEMIQIDRRWVGINTLHPNKLVAEAVQAGLVPELRGMVDSKNGLNQSMFSALHQELKGYKDGFLLESVHRPIIRDLISLYDDIHGIGGRALGGFLGFIFNVIGDGHAVRSCIAVRNNLQVTLTTGRKWFVLPPVAAWVSADGHGNEGVPAGYEAVEDYLRKLNFRATYRPTRFSDPAEWAYLVAP